MKGQDYEEGIVNNIPEIVVIDNYDYISSDKVIANIVIKGPQGIQTTKPLIKSKRGRYRTE